MKRYLVVLLVMSILFGCTGEGGAAAAATASAAVEEDSAADSATEALVAIPLSEISGTVKHYTFNAGGIEVRYFAVKGSDGVVRTAFDACEVCHNSGKGYTQVGSDVRCNNCGLSFRIDELGTKNKGKGCWPAYLPHEIQGDSIVIKKSDLEAGSYFFS